LLFFDPDGAAIHGRPFGNSGLIISHREENMIQLLTRAAAPATAALFALAFAGLTATTASAFDYCRRDITSYMLTCGFETMAQCQAMSSGRGGDCLRDPFLASPSNALAYQPRHVRARKAVAN
jgi:hypothetical protein